MKPSRAELDYVIWQNRACRFYLAARLLHRQGLLAPAAYCATQALELLLKATLIYWDKSFHPDAPRHAMAKLLRSVRNKVPGARTFDVPRYFFHERRYQMVSRYPSGAMGLVIPSHFLADLDAAFTSLVAFVPFQHNTELKEVLSGRAARALVTLRRGNASLRKLRKILGKTPRRPPRVASP